MSTVESDYLIKNGVITETYLGYEEDYQLTFYIIIKSDIGLQKFGGYALDYYDASKQCRCPTIECGSVVREILNVCNKRWWELLIGTPVRIKIKNNELIAIGNFIEDTWLEVKTTETTEAIEDAG